MAGLLYSPVQIPQAESSQLLEAWKAKCPDGTKSWLVRAQRMLSASGAEGGQGLGNWTVLPLLCVDWVTLGQLLLGSWAS